ncbi:hypothetical protein HYX15_00545 [Candidatus Woesearchaeota archaeon]|nr:hypothetical protein [Candidatus Woesearchaeota archaeon]
MIDYPDEKGFMDKVISIAMKRKSQEDIRINISYTPLSGASSENRYMIKASFQNNGIHELDLGEVTIDRGDKEGIDECIESQLKVLENKLKKRKLFVSSEGQKLIVSNSWEQVKRMIGIHS